MEETKKRFFELISDSRNDDEAIFETFLTHLRVKEAKAEAERLPLGAKANRSWTTLTRRRAYVVLALVLSVATSMLIVPDVWSMTWSSVTESDCLVDTNVFVMELSRPIFDCAICRNVREVPAVTELTKEQFLERYAYTDIPVLVKNATANWTAMSTFSFQYFRDLYLEAAERQRNDIRVYNEMKTKQADGDEADLQLIDEAVIEDQEGAGLACQFFPYKTEFDNLLEAFNMSEDRAAYKDGEKPWYFGWSNCHDEIQTELRRHYERPYFLPSDSETSCIDWIFMGGRGRGAPMHLDSVTRPSWQAQISGRKTWDLDPPPECLSECHSMSVTVEQGDIFVINTNVWYHGTFVHPGAISICIGSEYD
ncbi:hypothetical protein LSH36_55g00018 [Paralvinella palmiformis]|uniref:Cupin-like domain-containing protein n=1 Tax=Paralvinella palmiformis TaxID=53620 RepID=A0AAD9NCB0_9ANNE|nr:hypothetical protein LSH36_55g00018 [Paralvinella palmiformis]